MEEYLPIYFNIKDAIAFLKKRAIIEEEYGKAMLKLCQVTLENTGKEKIDNKQG